MEIRHLEQILAIYREGSFSGAARKLEITQPALSKSIARLEAQLGARLFERTGGGARPTAHGVFLGERAAALLDGIDSLVWDFGQFAQGEAARLRIAVGPATRVKPLPQLLALLRAHHPRLQLEVVAEDGPGVVTALVEGRVDIALGSAERARDHGDLIRKILYESPVIAVARPGHPALALTRATAADLLAYPVAAPLISETFARWAEGLDRGREAQSRAFISTMPEVLVEHVASTDAIGFSAAIFFEEALAEGRLAALSTTYEASYGCWLLTTRDRWRSPLVKAVAALAAQAAKAALKPARQGSRPSSSPEREQPD